MSIGSNKNYRRSVSTGIHPTLVQHTLLHSRLTIDITGLRFLHNHFDGVALHQLLLEIKDRVAFQNCSNFSAYFVGSQRSATTFGDSLLRFLGCLPFSNSYCLLCAALYLVLGNYGPFFSGTAPRVKTKRSNPTTEQGESIENHDGYEGVKAD